LLCCDHSISFLRPGRCFPEPWESRGETIWAQNNHGRDGQATGHHRHHSWHEIWTVDQTWAHHIATACHSYWNRLSCFMRRGVSHSTFARPQGPSAESQARQWLRARVRPQGLTRTKGRPRQGPNFNRMDEHLNIYDWKKTSWLLDFKCLPEGDFSVDYY
jgi:hypothetical protein